MLSTLNSGAKHSCQSVVDNLCFRRLSSRGTLWCGRITCMQSWSKTLYFSQYRNIHYLLHAILLWFCTYKPSNFTLLTIRGFLPGSLIPLISTYLQFYLWETSPLDSPYTYNIYLLEALLPDPVLSENLTIKVSLRFM